MQYYLVYHVDYNLKCTIFCWSPINHELVCFIPPGGDDHVLLLVLAPGLPAVVLAQVFHESRGHRVAALGGDGGTREATAAAAVWGVVGAALLLSLDAAGGNPRLRVSSADLSSCPP